MTTKEDAVLRLARARQNNSAPEDPKWDDLEPDDQALLVQNASADLALMASIGLLVMDADPPAPRGNACSCPPGPIGEGDYCGTQPVTASSEPAMDPVSVLCDRLQHAMDALDEPGKADEPWPLLPLYWDRLDSLLSGLLDDSGDPRADDPAALLVARVVLGEDVQP